jgi:DUF4097 and DUF4098 domain-containing protein YvlB
MLKSWILFALVLPVAQAEIATMKYPGENHTGLRIHNSFGDVRVAPSPKNEIVIVADKKKWGSRCKLNINANTKQLDVEINDQAWVMDNECRVDLLVSVPEKMPIELRTGSGNVSVTGTRGDLDVKVGSGKIIIQSELKTLSALTASGDITFKGLAESSKITTGYGDIDLQMNNRAAGRILVQSAKGDVLIGLPQGSKVFAQTQVGNGQVENAFSNDKITAEVDVQASTGDGRIQIREN